MGNETEKDLRNQQQNPTGTVDPSKKNPSHESGHNPSQQDPSKKNPSQGGDFRPREDEEGSGQGEKRRAS
jgi:hypothetical protein